MIVPAPPAIPASLAALVTLAGLGLIYWSLTGLGLLKAADAPTIAATGGVSYPAINAQGGVGSAVYGPPATTILGAGGGGGSIKKG